MNCRSRARVSALLAGAFPELLESLWLGKKPMDSAVELFKASVSVKLSRVSALADPSERGARYDRDALVQLGWISRDTGSTPQKLSREGACFSASASYADADNTSAREFRSFNFRFFSCQVLATA